MIRALGVDPGVRGGLAIIELRDGAPRLIDAADVPVVGTGAKERVDVLALEQWLRGHAPAHAFIERAQALPKQGASSGFKYGRASGAIEAADAHCAIPIEIVEPAMWKKALRLRGKDKEGARQYALQLFPHAHQLLRRKLDHQRAEAALIAYVGLRHLAPVPARSSVEVLHDPAQKELPL